MLRVLSLLALLVQGSCAFLAVKWGLADLYYWLGHSYLLSWEDAQEKHRKPQFLTAARGYLTEATLLRPQMAAYHEELGAAELNSSAQDVDAKVRALKHYERAIDLAPASPDNWATVAWLRHELETGSSADVCNLLKKAQQLGPHLPGTQSLAEGWTFCNKVSTSPVWDNAEETLVRSGAPAQGALRASPKSERPKRQPPL